MSKYEYIEGIGEWAHNLFVPDIKFPNKKHPEWGGRRHVTLRLSKDEYKKMKDVGLSHRVKPDPETFEYIYRPSVWEYGTRKDGTVFERPIEIVDKDGNPWPEDVTIGNGSKLVVKVETYTAKYEGTTSKEATLVRVQVVDHVKYENPDAEDGTTEETTSDDEEIIE